MLKGKYAYNPPPNTEGKIQGEREKETQGLNIKKTLHLLVMQLIDKMFIQLYKD